MIDPNSIKQIKYKNEDAVLACMLLGASVRVSALRCCVSSKTAHKIRLKHADKFPKKENKVKEVKQKKIAGVKRWVTVPPDVDAKIVEAAKENSRIWQEQANLIFEEWRELGDLNLGVTNFQAASDLSLKRIEFCKNMKPCPKCGTEQVQLIGWPDNPSWKCRHCREEWRNEKEFFHMTFGSEKFDIPFVAGETSVQMRERTVSYLNKHGEGSAMVEHDGISYDILNNKIMIKMGVGDGRLEKGI